MDKLIEIYNKIKKNGVPGLVWVLSACLAVVVAVLIFLPEAKATELTDLSWNASSETVEGNYTTYVYKLSDIAGSTGVATINVTPGNTYIIEGSEKLTTDGVHIKFAYSESNGTTTDTIEESNVGDVNVTLNNVNMTRSVDEPLIAFTTKNNSVNYHVTIENSCNLSSNVSGASLSPVMCVENIEYSVLKLSAPARPTSWEDYIVNLSITRNVSLYLGGANSESELTISEMSGEAYGAVIGSSESKLMSEKLELASEEKAALIKRLNDEAIKEKEITINNTEWVEKIKSLGFVNKVGDAAGGTFLPQYQYGSARNSGSGKIIIGGADGNAPLRVNIVSNSYGAAIGGGAGKETTTAASDAQKVTLNAGTVYINSKRTDVDAIGTGYSANTAEKATFTGMEINGGSINIVSGGNLFSADPVNAKGHKVYLVMADTKQNTGVEKLTNLSKLAKGTQLPLNYTFSEGILIEDLDKITESYVSEEAVSDSEKVNIADITVSLYDTDDGDYEYKYEGTGHSNVTASEEILYFYLPATEVTYLYISDNMGIGTGDEYASYIVTDAETNKEVNLNSTDESTGRKYILAKGKTYYIVPTAPTQPLKLDIESALIDGKSASNTAKGYVISTDNENRAIHVEYTYGTTLDVKYDDGLIASDRKNHSVSITDTDFVYGKNMTLGEPTVGKKETGIADIIFAGWEYVKEDGTTGDITEISMKATDGTSVSCLELLWSDNTIHIQAKWNIEISFVLDSGATMDSLPEKVTMAYGGGTAYKVNISVPTEEPELEDCVFMGWQRDNGDMLDDIAVAGSVQLSTLTSHQFKSVFKGDKFRVYIDASGIDSDKVELYCISANESEDKFDRDENGELNYTSINGTKYYYTEELRSGNGLKLLIKSKTGYVIAEDTVSMDNADIDSGNTTISAVSYDDDTASYYVSFTIRKEDVYVEINADTDFVKYEVTFKDGRGDVSEDIWNADFYYTVEDIANDVTIGDIIRRGLGKTADNMSDAAISDAISSIPKNDDYSVFDGWKNIFMDETYGSAATIGEILEESSLSYGAVSLTAQWRERGNVRLSLTILERNYLEDGTYEDSESPRYIGKLYYKLADGSIEPVYTEIETDEETGEQREIAYARPGDTLYIETYEIDENGEPVGEPVTESLDVAKLYYWYQSVRGEDGYINVHASPLTHFNVEDEAIEGTTVDVYFVYEVKKYKIIYWNLYGYDNSMNPTEFTVYDEFDFVPIADGVDWLLVCMDTDDSNNDEVKKEIITGVTYGGKPVTNGDAGNRNYVSNLVLMPDWGDVQKDEYTITIIVDGEEYGNVTIAQPSNATSYMAEQLILMSVIANEGYELVPESLVCKKEESRATYSLLREGTALAGEPDALPLQLINADDGTYLFTMPDSDVVVYATFRLREYTITYEDITADMLNPNPDTYNINSSITLEAVKKDGYTFVGWYDADGNKVETIAGRTGDIVLIPKFEAVVAEPTPNNPTTNNPATNNPIEITGRPSNIIVTNHDYIYATTDKPVATGDNTNVPRLVLICVAAVLLLLIVIIKKPRKDDEEEEGQETNTENKTDDNEKK